MDFRRILAFLALSIALMVLANWLFPLPQPPQPPQPAADAPDEQQAQAPPGQEQAGEQAAAAPEAGPLAAPLVDEAADRLRRFLTLGSLDSESGYRMLVTLTNRGAAVRRVELTSPRYRDLDDRSGYLGHLALEEVEGGVKVRVVGPGTPAAEAGFKPDDVIVSIGTGEAGSIATVDAFHAALADTRPGRTLSLQVRRGDGQAQPMAVQLARRPLEVIRPEIENVRMRDGDVPDDFTDPPSFLTTIVSWNGERLEEEAAARFAEWFQEGHWSVLEDVSPASVTFERRLDEQGLRLVKRYSLQPVPPASRDNENYPGYDLQLDLEIHNTSDQPQRLAYQLDGPTGLPIEGWWYVHKISQRWFSGAGLRDVAVRFQGGREVQIDCSTIAEGEAEPMGQNRSLAYAGVDALYFASILIPDKQSLDQVWFDTTEAVRVGPKLPANVPQTYTNVTCRLTRRALEIPPGEHVEDSFDVFIGPKRPDLLAQYQAAGDPHYSLGDLIYYGWFGAVARVMLWILHTFYSVVGNYGIAIILLTVLVRGAMFPISFKQTKSMAKMQALKPEMDRIMEKYKKDLQKRSQAMNDLYRKHNINPLGGCLPLLLQLPVFIGLYRALMVDVELRQASLFGELTHWCSNLSAPDMLFDWSGFMPAFITNTLGPYFNLLPIVTVGMFLLSMKLSMPPPTTEQAAMQQKIMKVMTFAMGLFFYKVASGLCLYLIASSAWGIGERKLLGFARQAAEVSPAGGDAASKSTREAPRGGQAARNGSPSKRKHRRAKRRR